MRIPLFKSNKEIEFHLFALKKLIMSDNKTLQSEKDCIIDIAKIYNLDMPEGITADELLNQLNMSDEEFEAGLEGLQLSPQHAKILVKDLITLALIDDEYCEEERSMVMDIGKKTGLSPHTIRQIEFATTLMYKVSTDLESILR